MAKAAIVKNYKLSATGTLDIDDDGIIAIENPDTGELIDLKTLLKDFINRPIKLSVTYDEDYE
jgi:hypothetical protein